MGENDINAVAQDQIDLESHSVSTWAKYAKDHFAPVLIGMIIITFCGAGALGLIGYGVYIGGSLFIFLSALIPAGLTLFGIGYMFVPLAGMTASNMSRISTALEESTSRENSTETLQYLDEGLEYLLSIDAVNPIVQTKYKGIESLTVEKRTTQNLFENYIRASEQVSQQAVAKAEASQFDQAETLLEELRRVSEQFESFVETLDTKAEQSHQDIVQRGKEAVGKIDDAIIIGEAGIDTYRGLTNISESNHRTAIESFQTAIATLNQADQQQQDIRKIASQNLVQAGITVSQNAIDGANGGTTAQTDIDSSEIETLIKRIISTAENQGMAEELETAEELQESFGGTDNSNSSDGSDSTLGGSSNQSSSSSSDPEKTETTNQDQRTSITQSNDTNSDHRGPKADISSGQGDNQSPFPTALKSRIPSEIPTSPTFDVGYNQLDRGEKLGSGGNADVYTVTAHNNGREYRIALKEPRFQGTIHSETIETFRKEAETWDKLDDSDYIVGVVDWDTNPLPWMALEYMDGGPLSDRVGEMEIGERVWTALCITRGVRDAHEHGIVHHDLKPENILFRNTEPNYFDVPKIADWGLAKLLLDHSKSVDGLSPQYSAPEQFDTNGFGGTDKQTDIYQLGAVFYELFTGEPPFEGQGSSVMYEILETNPDPPSSVDPTLPTEIDDIILRCLEKDQSDRYETIVYLRDDLMDFLKNSNL